jgi:hypothetical protein
MRRLRPNWQELQLFQIFEFQTNKKHSAIGNQLFYGAMFLRACLPKGILGSPPFLFGAKLMPTQMLMHWHCHSECRRHCHCIMGFTTRGKKAYVGYKKKYKNNLKRGGVPLNSVPCTADPLSNRKYKPDPTRMLSDADSVITPFQRRMMIGGHFLMDGTPMQSEWYGDDGAISKTLTLVGLPRNQAS